METILPPHEHEALLGENLRSLRLQRNWTQKDLSDRAGISVNALRNLENGEGTTLKTLIRILQALDRLSWLEGVAPKVSVNPLHMVRDSITRQRASGNPRRHGKKEKKKI